MPRHILWVKPVDATVPLHAANPPAVLTDLATQLELAEDQNGVLSQFKEGDDWGVFEDDLLAGRVRFQFARNPPSTNAAETVGKSYRVTVFGLSDAGYDVRYRPGTLTVVAA